MTEGSVDLNELEKLSPSNATDGSNNRNIPQPRYRLLLEPALVGAMMAINLGQTSIQNFYLQTACMVDLNNSLELCSRTLGDSLEADSQRVVSNVNISRSFVGALVATAVLLFVGPWSDYSGRRKPLLIMPLLGMSVMSTALILLRTFPGASTVQVLYAVQIPMSLGGNFGLLLAAAFSHIGDVCHSTGRDVTRTMGTHRAAIQVAHVVGSVGGPVLFRKFGYYGVFPIVLLLQVSSLMYVIFVMKDVNVNNENKVSVFNLKLPLKAFQCLVRPREGRRRMIIWLLLVVALGDKVLMSAEVLIAYMFYRNKFGWSDIMFGSFLAYRNIVSFFGTLIILTVLKRKLQLSDEVVGALSCLSYTLATSGLIAATTTLAVVLLPLIGIIAQGSQVVQRPLLNKQIEPNEQGKIYSVLGAMESATQMVAAPLYSLLYKKTVSSMPDAWLIPGVVLVFIQGIAYLVTKKLGKTEQYEAVKKNIPLENVKRQAKVEDTELEEEKHINKNKKICDM